MEQLDGPQADLSGAFDWGQRGIIEPAGVGFLALRADSLIREVVARQSAQGAAQGLIAEMTLATLSLAPLVKGREHLALHYRQNGMTAMAEVDGQLQVRARIVPAQLPWPDERRGGIDFDGPVTVVKWVPGQPGRPYQGQLAVHHRLADEVAVEVAEQSYQQDMRVALAVIYDQDGAAIGGWVWSMTLLPGGDRAGMDAVADRLLRATAGTDDPDVFMADLVAAVGEGQVAPLGQKPARFHCPFNPRSSITALASLGAADLRRLASEREVTEVSCEYCAARHRFSGSELLDLATALEQRAPESA